MLMSCVNTNGEVLCPVKRVCRVEVFTNEVKRKELRDQNFLKRLLFGDDVVHVEQRIKFILSDDIIVTDQIIDIDEDELNSPITQNYLNFRCKDGSTYEIMFEIKDTEDTLMEIYLQAREERPELIFSKIKDMKCMKTLKQVCFTPLLYIWA